MLYLPQDPTQSAVFSHTTRVRIYTVLLLICWFCVGGLLVFSMVRNSQYESFRQGRIVTMHAFKVYSKYLITVSLA